MDLSLEIITKLLLQKDMTEIIFYVVSISVLIIAFIVSLFNRAKKIVSKIYLRHLPIGLVENLKEASETYVQPFFTLENPDHEQEPSGAINLQKNLIKKIENNFKQQSKEKRMLILADAGMGKTAILLNIYYRHAKKFFKSFDMNYIELGSSNSIDGVKNIKNPPNTILLLDSLDENNDAITNNKETLKKIIALTSSFYRVVITCRTQFFSENNDFPELIAYGGGVMSAGEPTKGIYNKIYIAPFTDKQIKWYLRKKYFLSARRFSFKKHKKATTLIRKIPNISVRPMLLNYVDYLILKPSDFTYSYQIYEAMIKGWLERRKSEELDPKYDENLKFIYLLGRNLAINSSRRGGCHISIEELSELKKRYEIDIAKWQMTGRSLLNVDAAGNYKFSHLSILECILARALFSRDNLGGWNATTQTEIFLNEMNLVERIGEGDFNPLIPKELKKNLIGFDLSRLELSKKDFSNTNFSRAILKATKLSGSDLTKINAQGADLRSADLSNVNAQEADLSNVNAMHAKLQFADLSNANAMDANLQFTDLRGAILDDIDLTRASMQGSVLVKTKIENAKFEHANLSGATLSNTEFINCNLRSAKLLGAILTGTKFDSCDLRDADLRCIRIEKKIGTEISLPSFMNSRLDNAILPKDYNIYFKGELSGSFKIDHELVEIISDHRAPGTLV